MPPNVPAQLNLEPPQYEEDIGDLSPYLPLPSSTSSRASSATLGSSISASSPRNAFSEDEFDFGDPFNGTTSPGSVETPKRPNFSLQYTSPSSPSLASPQVNPRRLSRSQTLPRIYNAPRENTQPRVIAMEINALAVDPPSTQKMRRWILGIAVVEFDIDSGPVVDGIYPPFQLVPAESENIAFCAFPDSLQFDQGSQSHSFRVRQQVNGPSGEDRPQTEDGFMYGFAHFMQRRDSSSKRGYQQRSLVILTQHQYPALFSSVVAIFGPLFEAHGTPMLEAACHNIATWPDPTPGETLELGFLGTVLQVEIPRSLDVQQVTETSSFNEKYDPKSHILATTAPFLPPPLLLFEAALSNLWSIWECLVLCEPILVFGSSPAQTSQAVWWLRDLLRPIPLAGDIRPYFTMQDSDHMQLVNKLPPKAGLLLGVTNPFFEKSCTHWPHVLSLGRRIQPSHSPRQRSPALGAPAGPPPGWKTKTHKRYISKDRALLKQLENAVRGDEKARLDASLALRRHFCSRSTQLITPLARYLNTLIPSPSEVHHARNASPALPRSSSSSPFSSPAPSPLPSSSSRMSLTPLQGHNSNKTLRLKPFNSANFISSLKAHGSVLPFKSTSKMVEFYQRWLKSPAFGVWLAQQEQIVQTVLNGAALPSSTSTASPNVMPL